MNYPTGVPSPNVMHQHPYPTRFHGGIWTRPTFGLPYVRQPLNVVRPSQMAGLGKVTAIGNWDTADGVFRRPKVDGGGIFNAISGLGTLSPQTGAYLGAAALSFGLVYFLFKTKPKLSANKSSCGCGGHKKNGRRRRRR